MKSGIFCKLQLPRPWKPDSEVTLAKLRSTSSN
jgi:hypothetical protein